MSASGSSISTPTVIETPPERPFSWRFTVPLFIGSALNPINSSLIATALVPIAHGLGVSIGRTAALVTALYLASAVAQPTAGKAAEVFGPRRVFLVGIGLVLLCVYVVLYGVTQWVQTVRGLSETEAGLLLLPMTLVSGVVISPISRRNLVRGPVIAAALACLAGSAGVPLLSTSAWIGWVVVTTLVFGIAMGAAAAGNQTALYGQAPAEQLGTASGLLRTFGYLGSIAASAITGVVFHTHVSDHGVHLIAWIMVGVSVALVLMTVTDRTLRPRPSR